MNDFFWIGIGLTALGYFIGDGLRHFKGTAIPLDDFYDEDEPLIIKKKDLHHYLGIHKEDIDAFVAKYPSIPHIDLNGHTYFPHRKLIEWLESESFNKD
ncbi:DNA-binding protein [Pradoshia sp.]